MVGLGGLGFAAAGAAAQGPNAPPTYRVLAPGTWQELPAVVRGGAGAGRWTRRQESNAELLSEPGVGPILRIHFPQGHRGGTAPQSVRFPFPEPSPGVYIAFRFRASSGFTFNGNTQTKGAWLRRTGDPGSGFIVPQFRRGGSGGRRGGDQSGANPLVPSWNMQGLPDSDAKIVANLSPQVDLNDGKWHLIEMQMIASSQQGASDGVASMWIDGRPYFRYPSVKYFGPAWPHELSFNHFRIEPTYGGGRNPSPRDQYFDFGPIYISGGPR